MRALVLWAHPNHINLGVGVLAEGSHALLQTAFPGIDVRFRGTGPDGDGPMNLSHTRPLLMERLHSRRGLLDWLRSFDVVLDTRAGDSFADIYGVKRLAKMSVISEFVREVGVPYVLGPQTIGPFLTRSGRLLGRRVIRRASLVMVRDPMSGRCAARLGRPADAVVTDVAFALPVPQARPAYDVLVNVSGLLWAENPHVCAAKYRSDMTTLVRALQAEGRSVALFAHVVGEAPGDADPYALAELNRGLDQPCEVLVPRSVAEARSTVASARALVGARMHACLNALSVGTPAVPLGYSRKFAPLFEDLGWRFTVDLRTRDVVDRVRWILERRELGAATEAVLNTARERISLAAQTLVHSVNP